MARLLSSAVVRESTDVEDSDEEESWLSDESAFFDDRDEGYFGVKRTKSGAKKRGAVSDQEREVRDWLCENMKVPDCENFVWKGADLEQALPRIDPEKWEMIRAKLEENGWTKVCKDFDPEFVLIGLDNERNEYLANRVGARTEDDGEDYVLADSQQLEKRQGGMPVWLCCLCVCIRNSLGFLANIFWCIFAYVCPNCCCQWRWSCYQAPNGCCPRYYDLKELMEEMNTGDILLFCGTMSTRIGGQSHWSHVGMVLRDDDGLHGPKGLLYVFEANFGRAGWDHCDIRLLEEKVATYKSGATDVAWRRLNLDDEDAAETRKNISKAILNHRGDPYDHNMKRMTMAAMDCVPCVEVGPSNRKEMFCSQCVAQVLIDTKVLPEDPGANEYLPRDFGMMPSGNAEGALLRKVLGPLYLVKRHKPGKWTGPDCR